MPKQRPLSNFNTEVEIPQYDNQPDGVHAKHIQSCYSALHSYHARCHIKGRDRWGQATKTHKGKISIWGKTGLSRDEDS